MHIPLSIPFSASSHAWDAFDIDGVLHLGAVSLRIEYEGEWTRYDDDAKPLETVKWEAKQLEISFEDIVSIRLGRGWFGSPRIFFQAQSLAALDGFPLAKGVQCVIPVPWRNRQEARHLVAEVEAAIADAEIRRLES